MTAKKRHVWSKSDRERITGYVELWRGPLHLNGWQIDLAFEATDDDSDEDYSFAAHCLPNHPLRSGVKLRIYPHMLTYSIDGQCRGILHELVHIITGPLRQAGMEVLARERFVTSRDFADREEHAVDWVTNVVYALANEVRANPPKKGRP